jgi:hypothetical protein
MGLQIGDINATSGMSKAIFDQLNMILSPPLGGTPQGEMEKIRDSWRKLAFAIAKGVIEHITANMEIFGVTAQGNVNAAVSGNTAAAPPGPHLHAVNLSGVQNNTVFTQNNDGTGHVR